MDPGNIFAVISRVVENKFVDLLIFMPIRDIIRYLINVRIVREDKKWNPSMILHGIISSVTES
jgi:hypothetical protein